MPKNKYIKLLIFGGSIILIDQLSKALILDYLPLNQSIPVLKGFFNITHIHNPGGAFGLMANLNPTLRSLILIFYFYKKTPPNYPWLAAAFALIFGGAIGNLIDRFRFGTVIDFLDFYVGNLHWPAFNVADSAISAGIIIFVFHLIFKKMP
jgi:signal peptidase II